MFKHFNSIKMIIAMVMGLVIVASCEKEKQESKETTVTLEQVSVGLTSVKFSVTSTNALSAAYVIYPSLSVESAPAAGEIFGTGHSVTPNTTQEVLVENLAPSTSYTVAAVAKGEDGQFCEVKTLVLSTENSEDLYTFSLATEGEILDNEFSVKVTPSDENAYWNYELIEKGQYDGKSDAEIHAEFLRQVKAIASNEGLSLQEVLARGLVKGENVIPCTGLYPQTSYEFLVYGVDPNEGFITSKVERIEVTTIAQFLRLGIVVENITNVSADVTINASNYDDTYYAFTGYCAQYPDMTFEQIAEATIAEWGSMFDAGYGLAQGPQQWQNISLVGGTECFVIAFGYKPGEGLSTQVVGEKFTTEAAGDPNEFTLTFTITDTQAERVLYKVEPSDNSVFYMTGYSVKSEFNESEWAEELKTFLDAYLADYKETRNPNAIMENVVESVCYRGKGSNNGMTGEFVEYEFSAVPLEPETEYTIFAVAVNPHTGEAGKFSTVDVTTPKADYSDSYVNLEYMGCFSLETLQEGGYFTSSTPQAGKLVMVLKMDASADVETVKVKTFFYSEYYDGCVDSEIIDMIEPYWDVTYTGSEIAENPYIFLYFYDGSSTTYGLGVDSEGKYSKMARCTVNMNSSECGTLEDFEVFVKANEDARPSSVLAPKGNTELPAAKEISSKFILKTNR